MPNYQVKSEGLPFPVGAVLPASAFSHLDWLLSQNAVCRSGLEPTMEAPAARSNVPDGEMAAENARLQRMLGTLPGEAAALRRDHDAAVALHDEAEAKCAALAAELDAARAESADLRNQLHAARQGQAVLPK